jgi:hypothetical protein
VAKPLFDLVGEFVQDFRECPPFRFDTQKRERKQPKFAGRRSANWARELYDLVPDLAP